MDLTQTYNKDFYGDQQEAYKSAQKVLGLVYQAYKPSSVVDVGCGLGTWLKVWQELDSSVLIAGLDGNAVEDSERFIPKSAYAQVDLTQDYTQTLARAIALKSGGGQLKRVGFPAKNGDRYGDSALITTQGKSLESPCKAPFLARKSHREQVAPESLQSPDSSSHNPRIQKR